MFHFLTHLELSRSMTAVLEMPLYVTYQKNVAYSFNNLSAKSHSFNILCTMDVLDCPTTAIYILKLKFDQYLCVSCSIHPFLYETCQKDQYLDHYSHTKDSGVRCHYGVTGVKKRLFSKQLSRSDYIALTRDAYAVV